MKYLKGSGEGRGALQIHLLILETFGCQSGQCRRRQKCSPSSLPSMPVRSRDISSMEYCSARGVALPGWSLCAATYFGVSAMDNLFKFQKHLRVDTLSTEVSLNFIYPVCKCAYGRGKEFLMWVK